MRSYGNPLLNYRFQQCGQEDRQLSQMNFSNFDDQLYFKKDNWPRAHVSVLIGKDLWTLPFFRPPYEGLPPPGNPYTVWMTKDLNTMDVHHKAGESAYITDYVNVTKKNPRNDRPVATPARTRICLAEMLQPQEENPNEMTKILSNSDESTTQYFDIGQEDEELQEGEQPADPREVENIPHEYLLQLEEHKDEIEDFLHFNPPEDSLNRSFQDFEELPEPTQRWLRLHEDFDWETWDFTNTRSLEIYTDGSFKKDSAAWAFAVVAHEEKRTLFLGLPSSTSTCRPY